jgi:pyridoxal phosphate enzyme (YggS family)
MCHHIAENIRIIRDRIEAAAKRAGRNPSDVKLVAVTKTVDVNRIKEAVISGVTILGENRVQEAKEKIEEFNRLQTPDSRLQTLSWHMVGHLQTNKAKTAVQFFDLIHSVDSIHLADEIDRHAKKLGKIQRALIEVNLAGEKTKHGVSKEGTISLLKKMSKLKNISVEGLMTMPPFSENPEDARPHFKELKNLIDETEKAGLDLTELSMGMSNDFEVAIEEGATMVRIGTAIFGERK